MCGRARCSLSHDEVRAAAKIQRWVDEERYFPSYNSSPGHSTPVVKHSKDGELEIHTMKWGLIPSYTKADDKLDFFRMFNARSETVAEKGVFKRLLSQQRCIILLNGFYEWKKEGKNKQPYYIHQEGHEVMRMAGLFDCWHGPDGNLYSFTILTTDSSQKLQWLHDRMPVILPDSAAEQAWLSQDGGDLGKLCVPYNGEDLAWYAVDPIMSNARNDGPECCRPLKRKSIATFFKPKAQGEASTGGADVKHEPTAAQQGGDLKAEDGAAVAEVDQAAAQVKEERDLERPGTDPGSQDVPRSAEQAQGSVAEAADTTPAKDAKESKPVPSSKKRPAKASSSSGKTKRGKASDSGQGKLDSFFIKNSA